MRLLSITGLIFLLSVSSFAGIDTSGLTEEQKAQLTLQAVQMKGEPWAEVANAVGTGVAQTAESLGVAANEFVDTPVGKMTAFVIIYQFIGKDLVRLIVAATMWVIVTIIIVWVFKRVGMPSMIEYYENGKKKKVTPVCDDDSLHLTRFLLAIVFIANTIICLMGAFV